MLPVGVAALHPVKMSNHSIFKFTHLVLLLMNIFSLKLNHFSWSIGRVYKSIHFSLKSTAQGVVPVQSIGSTEPKSIDINKEFRLLYNDSLEEISIPTELSNIHGKVPSFLNNGVYIKNGPACFGDINNKESSLRYNHIFDGLAKLAKYEFRKSSSDIDEIKVFYSTKFLRSKLYENLVTKKKNLHPHFSVGPIVPKLTFFDQIRLLFGANDNTNVNIARFGKDGPWACTTDGPVSVVLLLYS